MSDQHVNYRLAHTVVRIVGTVTIQEPLGAEGTITGIHAVDECAARDEHRLRSAFFGKRA